MKTQIDSKSLYWAKIGQNTVYISYNTIVGISTPIDTYVSENVWSVTTARHLNRIEELTGSNREYRMKYRDFMDLLEKNNIDKYYN
jgi:hypothetical protein|tara:strand:- start:215 stop:472 length:258 start_codon:yes stop_codon:yes gene_type:complete